MKKRNYGRLNDEQRNIVEENLGIIKKVIFNTFKLENGMLAPGYCYDDAYQDGVVALSETLLKIEEKHFQPANLEAYLYISVRNELFSQIRSHYSKTYSAESYDFEIDELERMDSYVELCDQRHSAHSEEIENSILSDQVVSAIEKCKPDYEKTDPFAYDILIKKLIDGVSVADLSVTYGLSYNKTYRKQARALENLKKYLQCSVGMLSAT